MNEVLQESESKFESGCAVAKRSFDGMPQGHPVMDQGYDTDAHDALAQGAPVAEIEGKAEEDHKIDDAVPVVEEVQLDLDVLAALPETGEPIRQHGERAKDCKEQRAGENKIDEQSGGP